MAFRIFLFTFLLLSCGRTALLNADGTNQSTPVDDEREARGCSGLTLAEADSELMQRWNQVVDAVAPPTYDFRWKQRDDFPHPTYRNGNHVSYREFVEVLVRFWSDDDTLNFMACNALFDRRYNSGPAVERQLVVSLRPLTRDLSTSRMVDAEQQAQLARICAVIGCSP